MAKKVNIKFDVSIRKSITLDEIPDRWVKWFKAWLTDEDDRTDEQLDLVNEHDWEEVLSDILGEDICEVYVMSIKNNF